MGKTRMARALARSIGANFSRIQFTPDMLPSDVTGVSVFNQRTREFEFRPGPIMSQIVLTDEINRATPKPQAALLEAMEERQLTVEGVTYPLDEPFLVIATQNPIEYEGTFPLPEAQLDRFFLKLQVSFPDREQLHAIVDRTTGSHMPTVEPVLDGQAILHLQQLVREVPVARHVQDYAIRLLQACPPDGDEAPDMVRRFVRFGPSPRGAQATLLAAKIRALFEGRFAASTDDVKAVALPALRHRVLLNFEGEAEGVRPDQVLEHIIKKLPESKA